MNKSTLLLLVISMALPMGCAGDSEQETRTETIEPALPPAAEAGEDGTIMTQTTEVGEERSPNEGGILTSPSGVERQPPTTATSGSPPPRD
ncbi:MAG TPA: hypothetical protein VMS56_02945 [Thermoanaerobaculia bacterium]|nr:hypothetical protein [Thermoanaerobaculia bacterium]